MVQRRIGGGAARRNGELSGVGSLVNSTGVRKPDFGAGERDRSQQELSEMAEGGGFLTRDAPLDEQAKNQGEGAVHAGGGGEVAGGGKQFGKIERGAEDLTSGAAEQLILPLGVKGAEGGMNVRADHGALATVGESELTAMEQDFLRRRLVGEGIVWLLGPRLFGRIADRERRRAESGAWERFLYGVHTRWYHVSIHMSIIVYLYAIRTIF